ncbi:MAG: hypothetical protein AAFY59_08170 [Pseudomonadota bacterium]
MTELKEVARATHALDRMSKTGTIDPDVAAVAADTLIDRATALPRLIGQASPNTPLGVQDIYADAIARATALEMAARSIQQAGTNTEAFASAFEAIGLSVGLTPGGTTQPQ